MVRPDPEVDIAFLLMDQSRTGTISFADFAVFVERTSDPEFTFDLNSELVRRFFGPHGDRRILYRNFSQFLFDYQREMGRQAFLQAVDQSGTPEGYLPPKEFVRLLQVACGWRLPDVISERLENIYVRPPIASAEATAVAAVKAEKLKGSTTKEATKSTSASILAQIQTRKHDLGDRTFGYGDFLAFQEVLGQLPGVLNLIHGACSIKKGPISPDDFKVANRVIGLGDKLSRRQVEIIFQLFDLDHDGFISSEDTAGVVGVDFVYRLEAVKGREGKLTFAPPPTHQEPTEDEPTVGYAEVDNESFLAYVSNYMLQFGTAGAAGCVGAVAGIATAPADLVKTRMQLQRIRPDGVRMYNNTLDCFLRAFKTEGWAGLFRGTTPYIIGIAPQRACQLTVNQSIRSAFVEVDEKTGEHKVPFFGQVFAGACAGACQVLIANPLEMAKIQLHAQGETERILKAQQKPVPPRQTFLDLAAELGVPGLYKGSASCLLRDIPFSDLFFPSYYKLKEGLMNLKDNTMSPLATAGLVAGLASIPASIVSNPDDVIKSRIGMPYRAGDIAYNGLRHAAWNTYQYEGLSAFYKGYLLRILHVAPQLSLTMVAYEFLTSCRPELSLQPTRRMPPHQVDSDYRKAYPTHAIGPKTGSIDAFFGAGKKP